MIDVTIVGVVVASVEFDFSLRVVCSPPSGFTIETPVVCTANGVERNESIGEHDRTADPTFDSLLGRTITAASATEDGTLTLEFDDGFRIVAPVLEPYESWELTAPDGSHYGAGPDPITIALPKSGSLLWAEQHPPRATANGAGETK